jgi:hypothetical protein
MMGIMVPETCRASNKICNKNSSVASSWHFISTYYRRYTVKTTSNLCRCRVFFANILLRNWSCNLSHLYGTQTCSSECLEIRKAPWLLYTLFISALKEFRKKRLLVSSYPSVHLSRSAWNISAPTGRIFLNLICVWPCIINVGKVI